MNCFEEAALVYDANLPTEESNKDKQCLRGAHMAGQGYELLSRAVYEQRLCFSVPVNTVYMCCLQIVQPYEGTLVATNLIYISDN